MRRTLFVTTFVGTIFALGCSSAPEEADLTDDEAVVTTPEGDALQKDLANVFASGALTTLPDTEQQVAIKRLDDGIAPDVLKQLVSPRGEALQDGGGQAFQITRARDSAIVVAQHAYVSSDRTTSVSVVRVDDGAKARVYAERDVVRGQAPDAEKSQTPGALVQQVTSSLFTIDGQTLKRVSNDVATPADVSAGSDTISQQALHILSGGAGGFGDSGLCNACNSAIQFIQIGNSPAVNSFGAALLGAFLAHHTFTTACIGVGVVSAAAASETVAGAAPAAVGGYRGCRWVMAAVAAWAAARKVLPADAAGRAAFCNGLANSRPGEGHWCLASPSSCALSVIPQSGDLQQQCMVTGKCARDVSCANPGQLCAELFIAGTADAQAARDRCQKITSVACGPSIQTEADLAAACKALLQ